MAVRPVSSRRPARSSSTCWNAPDADHAPDPDAADPAPVSARRRLLILLAWVRLLDLLLHVVSLGYGLADARLMRQWLALHDAIGALLPRTPKPEPEHGADVRAILR